MRSITIAIAVLIARAANAQIEVPATTEPYRPIAATVSVPTMPEGATFDGGWEPSEGVLILPVSTDTVHIWATPGKHEIGFRGFWLHLQEQAFNDGDGNPITIKTYLGHGFVDESAAFEVLGGTDPSPGPDPIEPQPGQKFQVVVFLAADKLDEMEPAQRNIATSLTFRRELAETGHKLKQVIDDDQIRAGVPAKWLPWVQAVMGDPLPRYAIAPIRGGKIRDFPLPANGDALIKELAGL